MGNEFSQPLGNRGVHNLPNKEFWETFEFKEDEIITKEEFENHFENSYCNKSNTDKPLLVKYEFIKGKNIYMFSRYFRFHFLYAIRFNDKIPRKIHLDFNGVGFSFETEYLIYNQSVILPCYPIYIRNIPFTNIIISFEGDNITDDEKEELYKTSELIYLHHFPLTYEGPANHKFKVPPFREFEIRELQGMIGFEKYPEDETGCYTKACRS